MEHGNVEIIMIYQNLPFRLGLSFKEPSPEIINLISNHILKHVPQNRMLDQQIHKDVFRA